jgi:hypothetical protein
VVNQFTQRLSFVNDILNFTEIPNRFSQVNAIGWQMLLPEDTAHHIVQQEAKSIYITLQTGKFFQWIQVIGFSVTFLEILPRSVQPDKIGKEGRIPLLVRKRNIPTELPPLVSEF